MARRKGNMSFRESIRRTFLTYTLIPALVLTAACFVVAVLAIYLSAVHNTRQLNQSAGEALSRACASYGEEAQALAADSRLADSLRTGLPNASLSRDLYDFINRQQVHCDFYLLDNQQKLVSASVTTPPSFLTRMPNLRMGILRKVREAPDQVCLTIESEDTAGQRYIAVGKAVTDGATPLGTVVFVMGQEDFFAAVRDASAVGLVVTNIHDSVCWSTDSLLENRYGKLLDEFRSRQGLTAALGTHFYCCPSTPIYGAFRIYTFIEMGYNERVLGVSGAAIGLLLLLLVLGTLAASHKVAARQTQALDKVVATMSHVREGWLDQPLVLETGDEFEQIALSYNQMLAHIRRLMEDNREIAQRSVLSEIEQLESQFEPHFLFNTLELIKYLIRLDPAKAGKAIVCMSELLRESLDHSVSQVTLAQDLAYTETYLTIQKYRFEDQLDYVFQIPDQLAGCLVPKRILQPMVENSIKYGGDDGCRRLWISAREEEGRLVLTVEDNGSGIPREKLEEIRSLLAGKRNLTAHNGIYNVHRRIQLICGEEYGLRVDNRPGRGALVQMELPIAKER